MHFKTITAFILVPLFLSNIVSYAQSQPAMNMVYVEGGSFIMGCLEGRDKYCDLPDKPAHTVDVSSFYIGRYEVTVDQFKQFIDSTGYITDAERRGEAIIFTRKKWRTTKNINWRNNDTGGMAVASQPVTHVSWNDATEYCKWLSETTGEKYRLPTEAEWEFAARGGRHTRNAQYNSRASIDTLAWFERNAEGCSHPVGQKMPNELGIYDMLGNAAEWVNDWYKENYYKESPGSNPPGAAGGIQKVYRGGSWFFDYEYIKPVARYASTPDFTGMSIGFRVAKDN